MMRAATLLVVLLLLPGPQFGRPPSAEPLDPSNHAPDIPAIDPAIARQLQKRRLAQDYERMRRDTDTLGVLAAKLDAELAQSPESDAQAMEDARKIEKLAGEINHLMRQN